MSTLCLCWTEACVTLFISLFGNTWLLSTAEMKTHCSSHAGHLSLFPVCLCRAPDRCIQVFPSLPSDKAWLPHSLRTVPRSHSPRSLNSCALNLGNLRNCYFKNSVLKNRISFFLLLPWSLVPVHINVLRQGKFSDFLLVFEGLRAHCLCCSPASYIGSVVEGISCFFCL